MKRTVVVLTLALLANYSLAADAQGRPADPGTPLALVAHERVQKELNLSADQITTVKPLASDVRRAAIKEENALATLKKTLKQEQLARLMEISYQVRGGSALFDEAVVKALDVTKKQQGEMAEIWKEEEKKLQSFLARARFRSPAARDAYILGSRKKAGEKLLAPLSAEQKKQFTKMQGKEFDAKNLDG